MKNIANKLIMSAFVIALVSLIGTTKAFADSNCDSVYGGGETCDYDRKLKITKEVRIKGETSWKDKVTDVTKNDIVEFKITIKNKSDDGADKYSRLKIEDFLPSEMYWIGGSRTTEFMDDVKPGDSKTFIIEAKVYASEYDKSDKFEKCVVNKAELRFKDEFEGSDTATVCYGNMTPSELPKTGAETTLAISGLGMLVTGLIVRKKLNK
jgi:LPXTG-motif cell wall-anchored protein